MKKTVLFALCLTLLLSLSIFVVGCKKHTHSFTEKVTTNEYLATAADCVNEATYYFSCECGEKGTGRFKYGSPLGHSFTDYVSDDNATCTEDGTKTAVCERVGCGATKTRLAVNSKKGHTIVVDSGIKATCTTDALTEGKHCSVCNEVLVAQTVIPAAHTICIDHAVKLTCTTDGLTEGSHCSVCNEVLVAQTVISAKGHTEVIDEAVEPTAFTDGLTEGKHCSVCNNILVAQETIPSTGVYDGLKYSKLSDKTCAVIGVDGYTGNDIVIPKTIPNGYTVTEIGEKAFADCTATSIYIPDSIKKIGTRAFYYCTNITEIHIPSSVTKIGTQIFYKASNLNTVYYDSTYSNSDNPFLNIANIKKIVFGGNWIPPYILQSCVNITEVEMLNVTSVGELAFSGCNNLEKVNIGSIAKWCSIKFPGVWPYSDRHASNPLSYAHNLYLNGSLVTDLVIPNGVKSISEYAFVGCSSLKSVTIPDSVTSIGREAFYKCGNLTKIYINDIVSWCKIKGLGNLWGGTSNNQVLYLNNELITNLVIPDSVTSIGDYAFAWCSGLTSVTIPDSVTSIGNSAFSNCGGLTNITIPDSVTSIGSDAFFDCSGLTSITIPDSVISIGQWVFYRCRGLTRVNYNGTMEQWAKISKDSNWKYGSSLKQIICTDGTIDL